MELSTGLISATRDRNSLLGFPTLFFYIPLFLFIHIFTIIIYPNSKHFFLHYYSYRITLIIKKKYHRLYFVFFVSHIIITYHHHISSSHHHNVIGSSSVSGIRERAISAAHVASLVVVIAARVAHERESARRTRIAREVGTVIKSGITRHTDAVFVLITFLHALFMRKFESGFMGLLSFRCKHTRAGCGGSSIPIASSSIMGHRSSFDCLWVRPLSSGYK